MSESKRKIFTGAQKAKVALETITKQPPAKAGGFELRTESPDTHRLNDTSNRVPF